MKKLMMLMVAAVVLPVISFADLVPTVYVVPEGTADNTPTAPYDTWAKAANDIKTAAEAVATHGVVKALAGTYPSTTGYVTERAYELQVFADTNETAPGQIALSSPLAFEAVADADPDHHSIRVTYGSLVSGGNMMTDRGSSNNKRAAANFKLTFSGEDAKIDASDMVLYIGYWSDGSTVRFTDGASAALNTIYMGQANGSSFTSLIVENGASVTLSGLFNAGTGDGTDATIVVSNATLHAKNYVFGKSANEKRTKIVLAGAAPRLKSNSTGVYNGDTDVLVDLSEMPLSGYANYPFYHSGITFEGTASLTLGGLDALRTRLRDAGITQLTGKQFAISFGGAASMSIPASVISAANERASGSGFSLRLSGAYVYLDYTEPGVPVTYVNADSANPAAPYADWTMAAANLSDGFSWVAKEGTVKIASGTYSGSPVAPEYAVTYEAVTSPTDDTPGSVVFGSTIFSGLAGTNTDPLRHVLTLARGTFALPSGTTLFIDSTSAGYGNNTSNRLVVTGSETVLNDASHDLYVGQNAKNTQLTVKDGAKCYANTVYSGRSGYSAGSTILVKDGALLSCKSLSMGEPATDVALVVDNATVSCSASFDCGKNGSTLGGSVTLKGAAPYLLANNIATISGDTTLDFDVGDLPLGKVDDHDARIFTAIFRIADTAKIRISGLDRFVARHEEDKSSSRTLTYPLVYGWSEFTVPDQVLEAARANLPEGCTLTVSGKKLILTVKKQLGMVLLLR